LTSPPETVATVTRPRILVAEDNSVNQKLVAKLLEKLGYQVHLATNGSEAVQALSQGPFAAVLMDCQMPEMDGLEATAQIRQLEKENATHTPIIAVTAHAMKGDKDRCLAAGMDDYVTKPINPQELKKALARWTFTPTGEIPQFFPASLTALNVDEALAQVGGDRDLLEEMAEIFLEEYPHHLAGIKNALAHRDALTLARLAHTLKGSVGNFAAKAPFETARRLEHIGRQGDLSQAAEILAQLEGELSQLKPALIDIRSILVQ
jgi:CheY-like chemotaxis protein